MAHTRCSDATVRVRIYVCCCCAGSTQISRSAHCAAVEKCNVTFFPRKPEQCTSEGFQLNLIRVYYYVYRWVWTGVRSSRSIKLQRVITYFNVVSNIGCKRKKHNGRTSMIEHWKLRAHGHVSTSCVSYVLVYYILNSRCRDTNFSDACIN